MPMLGVMIFLAIWGALSAGALAEAADPAWDDPNDPENQYNQQVEKWTEAGDELTADAEEYSRQAKEAYEADIAKINLGYEEADTQEQRIQQQRGETQAQYDTSKAKIGLSVSQQMREIEHAALVSMSNQRQSAGLGGVRAEGSSLVVQAEINKEWEYNQEQINNAGRLAYQELDNQLTANLNALNSAEENVALYRKQLDLSKTTAGQEYQNALYGIGKYTDQASKYYEAAEDLKADIPNLITSDIVNTLFGGAKIGAKAASYLPDAILTGDEAVSYSPLSAETYGAGYEPTTSLTGYSGYTLLGAGYEPTLSLIPLYGKSPVRQQSSYTYRGAIF